MNRAFLELEEGLERIYWKTKEHATGLDHKVRQSLQHSGMVAVLDDKLVFGKKRGAHI